MTRVVLLSTGYSTSHPPRTITAGGGRIREGARVIVRLFYWGGKHHCNLYGVNIANLRRVSNINNAPVMLLGYAFRYYLYMKRKDALNLIMYAGYHADKKEATRLYIENRVSFAAFQEHYRMGANLKERGMRCGCYECKTESVKPETNTELRQLLNQ